MNEQKSELPNNQIILFKLLLIKEETVKNFFLENYKLNKNKTFQHEDTVNYLKEKQRKLASRIQILCEKKQESEEQLKLVSEFEQNSKEMSKFPE